MGQAKSRGSFEQRKAAAIERDALADTERRRRRLAMEAAMTPNERAERHRAGMLLASIAGLTVGLSVNAPPALRARLEALQHQGESRNHG